VEAVSGGVIEHIGFTMIHKNKIGTSVNGAPIEVMTNCPPGKEPLKPFTLIIGGMHGDERAPVPMLENFIQRYMQTGIIRQLVCVLPLLNPDGYAANTRLNARGVDINRNFPGTWSAGSTAPSGIKPLSEPESMALHDFILQYKPAVVVNLHWALSEIDPDGKQSCDGALALWEALTESQKRLYRLRTDRKGNKADITCPGSLGQWCGYEVRYAGGARPKMITVELPYTTDRRVKLHPLPQDSYATIVKLWKKNAVLYMREIEPSVHAMLLAACRITS
jgi:protein MpaA